VDFDVQLADDLRGLIEQFPADATDGFTSERAGELS
jgi:hypothetical protein